MRDVLTRKEAQEFVDAVVILRTKATDAQASMAVGAYPALHTNGELIEHGTRINWNGTIKRAAVDLYDNEQNTPDAAPTLWEDILYREGFRIIPETITVGTQFAQGERGWWGDALYESKINTNTWTPKDMPDYWTKVEETL